MVDEVSLDDLADEQLVLPHESGWAPRVPQLDFPPMSVKDAVEVVAAGSGVLLLPMSVARLHHRKDVTHRPVTDLPTDQGRARLAGRQRGRAGPGVHRHRPRPDGAQLPLLIPNCVPRVWVERVE